MAGIAVMGAGAVGCYYGALLAEAGEAVTLIGRPALAAAVRDQGGLFLETGGHKRLVPAAEAAGKPGLSVVTGPEGVAGADLVLFAVKSGDTEAAGRQIAPHLAPGAAVLSLQNGVGNAPALSEVLGREVIPTVVYVAVEMAGPGHVRHKGRGELILGPGAGADAAALRLGVAGIRAEVSDRAQAALWTKFTVNCVFNAASALTRQPYGVIAAQPGAEAFLRGVMAECLAVARASGVDLPQDFWPIIEGIITGMPGQFSSTAQDLMRGKKTEIDHLNGEVLRRAEALGLAVPLNAALWVMVKAAEAG
ncbi:ketopantoate reductase family protein [Pseudogemmobacter sonorensis]|uniref:ketopantoate reductase family protein n=1 Tax=Pseudogemmobacter sonorensis TaxID=2989681 RepID=UPI00367B836D